MILIQTKWHSARDSVSLHDTLEIAVACGKIVVEASWNLTWKTEEWFSY